MSQTIYTLYAVIFLGLIVYALAYVQPRTRRPATLLVTAVGVGLLVDNAVQAAGNLVGEGACSKG